ncbi:MAG: hypothetical protein P8179_04400 [Candidatus Thiodiazotropha sp.]
MAIRPIFIPNNTNVGVSGKLIEFKWHPGMAISQKQKSIKELHATAHELGINNILEISSKSENEIGVQLSAFNLVITNKKMGSKFTVETAFQGSKVFERGGPYVDLYGLDSIKAKKDIRLKESGNLKCFEFFNKTFPLVPRTYFYDWLYINALVQNEILASDVLKYNGFSDIEFNPKKSINCQAHAVALYISLHKQSLLSKALSSSENFLVLTADHYKTQSRNIAVQDIMI